MCNKSEGFGQRASFLAYVRMSAYRRTQLVALRGPTKLRRAHDLDRRLGSITGSFPKQAIGDFAIEGAVAKSARPSAMRQSNAVRIVARHGHNNKTQPN